MTTPPESSYRPPARPDPPPAQPAPTAPASPSENLQRTLQGGARAFDERAQALGREAEAAVNRLGANPAVRETADMAGRVWGLVLLAFGLWFFAAVTLKLDLPAVSWGDLWPLALVLIGGLVIIQGIARRP